MKYGFKIAVLALAGALSAEAQTSRTVAPNVEQGVCNSDGRTATFMFKTGKTGIALQARFYAGDAILKLGTDDAADASTFYTVGEYTSKSSEAERQQALEKLVSVMFNYCGNGQLPDGLKKVGTEPRVKPSEPKQKMPWRRNGYEKPEVAINFKENELVAAL